MASTNRGLLPELSKLRVAPSQAVGKIVLENRGDAEAFPVWEVRGPGDNFVAVSPTGEVLRWIGHLDAGETLTIDTQLGTVIDGNGVNRYAELDTAPRFWSIPPGLNEAQAALENTEAGRLEPTTDPPRHNFVTNPAFVTSAGTKTTREGVKPVVVGVTFATDTDGWQDTAHALHSGFALKVFFPTPTVVNPGPTPTTSNYPSETTFPSETRYPSES